MKPTSIIFLILSVVLLATGLGICFIAKNAAEKDNIQLFTQVMDEEDNAVETYDFSDAGISKISLILKNVDVNIIGNADESKIEMYNFSKNTFDFKTNSKTITLDNTIGFISLFKFSETGFEFSGLRHYLNLNSYKNKPQIVNIYIKPDEQIKIYDIQIYNGNVNIKDLKFKADYNITLTNGNITAHTIYTSSYFKTNITEKGNITLKNATLTNAEININHGDLGFYNKAYHTQSYNVTTPLGIVYVNDENKGSEYLVNLPVAASSITATVSEGNAYIGELVENMPQ